jgi:hypothetical protein
MSLIFNTENWPIVYLKIDKTQLNDETYEEYQRAYLNLLIRCKRNNEKMIIICNLSNANNLPLNIVMKQMQFNKDIYKFNKEYLKCACILCNNKYFKNVLNTYFNMVKPAAPYKICRCYDKINKYLLQKFDLNFDSNIFQDGDLIDNVLTDISAVATDKNLEYMREYMSNIDKEKEDSSKIIKEKPHYEKLFNQL